MDVERAAEVVDAIIDEYLKAEPNSDDLKLLMKQLKLNYSQDDLENIDALLHEFDHFDKEEKGDQNV